MADGKRNVLFCTVGATPQVVTETVWCLIHQTPSWKPQKIHLATTAFKLDFIRETLQTKDGPLGQLLGGIPPVTVHVPHRNGEDHYAAEAGEDGHASADLLRDINDADQAARMGNLILRIIAGVTSDPGMELHVSLAGGRKTMSAHALMALSLVGRAADKASHVLVDPEYEDHPGFWHPDQVGLLNTTKELRRHHQEGVPLPEPLLDPAMARLMLVPTPVPLMRNRVVKGGDLSRLDLLDLMQKVNLAAALEQAPRVTLHVHENSISAHGVNIKLSAKHFAVYRLLAMARREKWPGAGPDGVGNEHSGWLTLDQVAHGAAPDGQPIPKLILQHIRDAEQVAGEDTQDPKSSAQVWANDVMTRAGTASLKKVTGNLNSDINRIQESLIKAVEVDAAKVLTIHRGPKAGARFGLKIAPEDIEIL